MVHRAAPRLTLGELIAEGTEFSRRAWRDCWLIMLLVIGVQTFIFARGHIAPADWSRSPLDWIVHLGVLLYIPLFGGLYRAALEGHTLQTLGPGGLQWRGIEWRLIAVGAVIAFLVALVMTPFLAVTGIAALVTHNAVFDAGPLGQWARWTPVALGVWLIFFWIAAPRTARLMLGWAYSSAREKTEPFAGWQPAERSGWSLAFALIFAGVPLLLGWLALYAMTLVEPDALIGDRWPIPEAVGAGLLLAALKVAVVAPLSVGVLSGAYWLLEERRFAGAAPAVDHPAVDHGAAPAEAAVAAAALSAQEAAELGLAPSEVDHAVTDGLAPAHGETDHAVEAPADAPPEHHVITEQPAGPSASELAAAEQAVAASDANIYVEPIEPVPETVHPAPAFPETLHSEPAEPVEEAHHGFEPLSPWPHSVLPPWHGATRTPWTPARGLASRPEPAHPSVETMEPG